MYFMEKESFNFILNLRELFSWRNTVLRAHGIKFHEKPFSVKFYAIFREKW